MCAHATLTTAELVECWSEAGLQRTARLPADLAVLTKTLAKEHVVSGLQGPCCAAQLSGALINASPASVVISAIDERSLLLNYGTPGMGHPD
jgi:hypothetical protein